MICSRIQRFFRSCRPSFQFDNYVIRCIRERPDTSQPKSSGVHSRNLEFPRRRRRRRRRWSSGILTFNFGETISTFHQMNPPQSFLLTQYIFNLLTVWSKYAKKSILFEKYIIIKSMVSTQRLK